MLRLIHSFAGDDFHYLIETFVNAIRIERQINRLFPTQKMTTVDFAASNCVLF